MHFLKLSSIDCCSVKESVLVTLNYDGAFVSLQNIYSKNAIKNESRFSLPESFEVENVFRISVLYTAASNNKEND